MRIAILDDYRSVALLIADRSSPLAKADVVVFADHLADEHALAEQLASFEVDRRQPSLA